MSQIGETRPQKPEPRPTTQDVVVAGGHSDQPALSRKASLAGGGQAFFTSIGCMDGRVQEPIISFGKKMFGVKYADTITEAGLVGLLAKKEIDKNLLQSIKEKITISLEKHQSKGIIIHGHQDCAGNPVEDGLHKKQVIAAAKLIKSFIAKNVKVVPVFLHKNGEEWIVGKLNY